MELRYKRKMKMPVWSLPGFKFGTILNNDKSANYMRGIGGTNDITVQNQSMYGPTEPWRMPIQKPDFNTNMNIANWLQNLQGNWQASPMNLQRNGFGDIMFPDTALSTISPSNTSKGNVSGGNGFKLNRLSGDQWSSILLNGVLFAGATAGSFAGTKTEGDLYNDAGMSTGYGAGYNYMRQNQINYNSEMSQLRHENTANTFKATSAGIGLGAAVGTGVGVAAGAGIGSAAGPIGAAAGAVLGLAFGIAGSEHRKHKLRQRIFNAQMNVNRMNEWQSASAQTDYLGDQFYLDNGQSDSQMLYSAEKGKDSGTPVPPTTLKGKVRDFNNKLKLPDLKND